MSIEHPKQTRSDYPYQPIPFTAVHLADQFWAPRLQTSLEVTIPYDLKKCEETPRIRNFEIAGGAKKGKFEGIHFDDSDLYKIIEGASYSLRVKFDENLDRYLDELIAKIAAAQEDDGYLYTPRTIDPYHMPEHSGSPERWSNIKDSHELYNLGHMYEAAVAHFEATGKRSFLNIAIKSADLIDRVFGPEKRHGAPGHEEIEVGLVRLYRVTGEDRYLKLAKFFLDERGNAADRELYGIYYQDHLPIIEQQEAVGHSVRAGYLYSGIADVAALLGDEDYLQAIDRIWENAVTRRMYLTGGIGSRHKWEEFGEDYELPNLTAYNETCAAIANIFWNHRLFLLHGDAKYLDVLERTLYNGFLSGISLDGTKFFYPNPLESDGEYLFNKGAAERQPWFDCSCCPSNVARFVPSIPGYVFARKDTDIFVNLFISGSGELDVNGTPLKIEQETNYPWDGGVTVIVTLEEPAEFTLNIRIPGWAQGAPVPGDLYQYLDKMQTPVELKVNGQTVDLNMKKGFACISREWHAGDTVELRLPMAIRRVVAHEKVITNVGRTALERGPIVFCAEGIDHENNVLNLILPDETPLNAKFEADLLSGVMTVTGQAQADGQKIPFKAIPYYAWNHRGVGEMAVWFPRTKKALQEKVDEKAIEKGGERQ